MRSLKQMSQTIYMGGVLVGAFIFGGLSDRYLYMHTVHFIIKHLCLFYFSADVTYPQIVFV